jgi:hypothetical protein
MSRAPSEAGPGRRSSCGPGAAHLRNTAPSGRDRTASASVRDARGRGRTAVPPRRRPLEHSAMAAGHSRRAVLPGPPGFHRSARLERGRRRGLRAVSAAPPCRTSARSPAAARSAACAPPLRARPGRGPSARPSPTRARRLRRGSSRLLPRAKLSALGRLLPRPQVADEARADGGQCGGVRRAPAPSACRARASSARSKGRLQARTLGPGTLSARAVERLPHGEVTLHDAFTTRLLIGGLGSASLGAR